VDSDDSLPAAGVEELFDESEGLEYFERAWTDGCAVPVERARKGIDEMAWHSAAPKFGGEEQTGRPGTDD
jgi:hypothetical protein